MDSCKIYILLAEFFSLQNCIRSLSGQDTPIPTRVRKAQRLQGNIFLIVIYLYLEKRKNMLQVTHFRIIIGIIDF